MDFNQTLQLLEGKYSDIDVKDYRGFRYWFDEKAPKSSQWKAKHAGVTINTNSEDGIKRMIDAKFADKKDKI